MTNDAEGLPLEATSPYLDAVQTPVSQMYLLLDEIEGEAGLGTKETDPEVILLALGKLQSISVRLEFAVRGVR